MRRIRLAIVVLLAAWGGPCSTLAEQVGWASATEQAVDGSEAAIAAFFRGLDADQLVTTPLTRPGTIDRTTLASNCPPGPGCRRPCHQWTILPQGLIYGSYLAGVKESRFRAVWNDETDDGDIWDVTLGGRAGILRYGYLDGGRPVGWQLDIEGAGLLRLDLDENMDVSAADYRFGIPLTWGDRQRQVKFAYYHLSSHLGDEFLLKNPGFPRLNYVRDVLVLGYSWTPDACWRYYFEIGYGVNVDVAEPWELQMGVSYSPPGPTGLAGAPFFAFNGYLREELNYGGNFVAQSGWAWRRCPTSGMLPGVEYYTGKDDQFSFFDQSVQKVGFGLWYDY